MNFEDTIHKPCSGSKLRIIPDNIYWTQAAGQVLAENWTCPKILNPNDAEGQARGPERGNGWKWFDRGHTARKWHKPWQSLKKRKKKKIFALVCGWHYFVFCVLSEPWRDRDQPALAWMLLYLQYLPVQGSAQSRGSENVWWLCVKERILQMGLFPDPLSHTVLA